MSKKTPQKIVVSGIQPTGRLHIGNYLGAVKNWLEIQDDPNYRCFFFIADWHSMTVDYKPSEKRRQVQNLTADLLALGLDPEKVTLFAQSDVLDHAELTWIFNCLTPMSELERMTQYKDKALRHQKNVNAGLFTYPILQAADILMYKGDLVPVGADQVQHVELTRDAARWFNRRFGAVFPETKPLLTKSAKIRSLTEPTAKMSKSHGEKSCLFLDDSPEEILDKMKKIPTEATGLLKMTEQEVDEAITTLEGKEPSEELKGMAGVWNLISLVREFGSLEESQDIENNQPIRYGDLKKRAAELVSDHLADFRERRADIKTEEIEKVLTAGAERSRSISAETMKQVRDAAGLGQRR